MNVKSETLTHFTKKFEYLEDILTNNFIPRLSTEDYKFIVQRETKILIPMVCFCDIPLHLIDNHISEYGHYGIGLSKEWAIKNQLNPVIYLEKHSALTDCFGTIFDTISDDCVETFFDNISNNKDNPELLKYFQNVLEHLWKIFCYLLFKTL